MASHGRGDGVAEYSGKDGGSDRLLKPLDTSSEQCLVDVVQQVVYVQHGETEVLESKRVGKAGLAIEAIFSWGSSIDSRSERRHEMMLSAWDRTLDRALCKAEGRGHVTSQTAPWRAGNRIRKPPL